jgi:hypothetical protein
LLSIRENVSLDEFDQTLIDIIGNDHPETLKQAIQLAQLRCGETDKAIMERVLRLERQGKILFENSSVAVPSSLSEYFLSGWATWFWVVFGLAAIASVMVFVVPEDSFPAVYARYLFGSVFVLFLPGYSLIRALFGNRELDNIERFALSLGLSLALVPMAGLLLNYTPFGIRTTPITFSLLALTLVFASAAVVRDYRTRRKMAGV